MIRIIRNLLNLARTMAAIDPALFEGFVLALPEAITHARAEAMNPPGFWQMLNKFRSKDLRRGLVAVNSLLEEWGRDFASDRPRSSTESRTRT